MLKIKPAINPIIPLSVISAILILLVSAPAFPAETGHKNTANNSDDYSALKTSLFPESGFKTKIVLGDAILKLIESGAIDMEKFKQIYASRGGLTEEELKLLTETSNEPLTI